MPKPTKTSLLFASMLMLTSLAAATADVPDEKTQAEIAIAAAQAAQDEYNLADAEYDIPSMLDEAEADFETTYLMYLDIKNGLSQEDIDAYEAAFAEIGDGLAECSTNYQSASGAAGAAAGALAQSKSDYANAQYQSAIAGAAYSLGLYISPPNANGGLAVTLGAIQQQLQKLMSGQQNLKDKMNPPS